MKNVTAIVISFLRPGYTKACINSLREMYPEISIVVGENGEYNHNLAKACKKVRAQYVPLPFDSGVCVARNFLIKQVTTEYVLVGDDDFYYDSNARVPQMKDFLEAHQEFDLIGGRVLLHGKVQNYQGFIEKKADHFHSHQLNAETAEYETCSHSGLRYCRADLTFNYFVARTEKVALVPWDEKIKVAYEHYSWFYDFKLAGGKVAFSPDPVVVHKPEHVEPEVSQEYAGYRNRKSDRDRFFEKYGISYTISMNGKKTYAPNYKGKVKGSSIKHVDFCITTFMRPKALERLMYSIANHCPTANVYIADQNKELNRTFYKKLRLKMNKAGLIKRFSVKQLPFDCGLAYARNWLVRNTPNKYKLILDDDMEFTEATDVSKMVTLLDDFPRAGVVGGLVMQTGVEVHFEFNLEVRNGCIYQVPDGQPMRSHKGIRYKRTGCVLNFALFRGELFNYIQWDKSLKVTEHMDFYLRMNKAIAYNVLYTPDVVVDHPPTQREANYKQMRQRKEFMVKMLQKHGATKVKYLNGQVTEIENGALKRYRETPE